MQGYDDVASVGALARRGRAVSRLPHTLSDRLTRVEEQLARLAAVRVAPVEPTSEVRLDTIAEQLAVAEDRIRTYELERTQFASAYRELEERYLTLSRQAVGQRLGEAQRLHKRVEAIYASAFWRVKLGFQKKG